jgi:hypothetical protein
MLRPARPSAGFSYGKELQECSSPSILQETNQLGSTKMKHRLFSMAAIAAGVVVLCCQDVKAQSEVPRIEVGGHYTFMNFNGNRSASQRRDGVGGRLTYNLTRNIAVEGIVNFFPGDVFKIVVPPSANPKPRLQALAGLKAGIRRERFGVFATVHPGLMRFTPVEECRTTDFSSCRDVLRNEFTLNFGGVAEAYLSRHLMLRFDVGDTYLRFADTRFVEENFLLTKPGFKTHNLQMSIGAGFRF